jgi:type I restriction enzyme S subunit
MARKYQVYPEYKNTGVKWLGELPVSWSKSFVKHWLLSSPCYGILKPDKYSGNDGVKVIRILDVTNRRVKLEQLEMVSNKLSDEYSRTLITKGDLIVSVVGTLGRNFICGIEHEGLNLSRALARLQVVNTSKARYLQYLIDSKCFDDYVNVTCTGAAQKVFNMEDLSNWSIPCAGDEELESIANFLDQETAKIDTLIEKQKLLIKLLKEKWQAMSSNAVTKGLNPNAPMRNSGVEWLGEVPTHWNVAKFKYLISESAAGPYGSSLTKSMYTTSGIRVYGQQQVISDDLSIGDYYISERKFEDMGRYEVFPNELLISVMGTVGRVTVVPEGIERGIINPRLVKYRVMEDKILPYFAKASILSDVSQSQLLFAAQGSTMDGLNMKIIGELPVPYPPSLDEQLNILNEIQRQSDKFDKLLKKSYVAIDLLKERRTALISAAVTGKIDVRHFTSKNGQTATSSSQGSINGG